MIYKYSEERLNLFIGMNNSFAVMALYDQLQSSIVFKTN